jgi:hypothetical protein
MFFLDLNPTWGATFCAATVGLGRASVGTSAGGPLPEGGHAGGIAGPKAPERMDDVGPWPQLEGGKVMVEAFLVKFIAACGRGGIDQSQRLDKLKALLGFATRCDHDVLTALPGGLELIVIYCGTSWDNTLSSRYNCQDTQNMQGLLQMGQ